MTLNTVKEGILYPISEGSLLNVVYDGVPHTLESLSEGEGIGVRVLNPSAKGGYNTGSSLETLDKTWKVIEQENFIIGPGNGFESDSGTQYRAS